MAPTAVLECTNPECTLGDGGARYKTPVLEMQYAMQMLVMHRQDNYQQAPPVVNTGVTKYKAE